MSSTPAPAPIIAPSSTTRSSRVTAALAMTELFHRYQAQTNPQPLGLEVARAEGLYLYDADGKRYADLISGLAVSNLGHRHPVVVAAIQAQLARYLHVMPYGEFVQAPQVQLAKHLAAALPDPLDTTYFVNSGAEAVEGALKLAKRVTGRRQLVACHHSYHGSTHGALSVTGNPTKRTAFEPLLPEVDFIPFNELLALDKITEQTAGVIIETVQGDAGVRIPSAGWLQAVRKRCTEVGALLILDEIQTGFGRTGTLFAFEQFGVVPDVLCLGKAIGGGMPMGAFVASQEHMHELSHSPMLGHITTFGGHPVCCAAGLASLRVIQGDLLDEVAAKGARIVERLQHPLVREIRQIGLMLAIDLPNAELTYQVVARCLERGVLTFYFLSCPASFRLAPPLTITMSEIDACCAIIYEVLDEANAAAD